MSTTNPPLPGHDLGAPDERPMTKWTVLVVSVAFILVVAVWALIAPEQSASILGAVVGWTSEWFGWFYIALATAILLFVIIIGVRYRHVRLGKDDDRPEFSLFSWSAMLFAAGIGTDLMFFAVAEPASQYLFPPQGEPESLDAAREASVWAIFHYGITGWGMYALMGLALGFYVHRLGLPLAIRSTLYPLIGKRIKGPVGDAVDIATVLGTIFGVATTLGIGVVMLNVGLGILFGTPQGLPAQVILIALAVGVATVSAVTGVDRGIRILSQLNVLLAIFLAAWVLVTGQTAFLLRAIVMNVGDFVSMFPGMTMDTMAFDYPADWMSGWTLFFWAWWIAWASFVGLFLARISKGRTIGQFVVGTLTIPFSYIVMWISIFGNTAVQQIRQGDAAFGETAVNVPEEGFYALLQQFPGAFFIVGLATFVGLLFYVTSADSGALVMANLSSDLPGNNVDAQPWLRILWAVATGVLTAGMLVVGGIPALQNATIIMGLPFAFVIIAVMVGLPRALAQDEARTLAQPSRRLGELAARPSPRLWRRRVARAFGVVSVKQADEHLEQVVLPALEAVRAELAAQGVDAEVQVDELQPSGEVLRTAQLVVHHEDEDFRYPVRVRRQAAPSFGARVIEADDETTTLDVDLPTGGSYDVMAYDMDQVCNAVLDHYERWSERLTRTSTVP